MFLEAAFALGRGGILAPEIDPLTYARSRPEGVLTVLTELGKRTDEGFSFFGDGEGLFTKGPRCGYTRVILPEADRGAVILPPAGVLVIARSSERLGDLCAALVPGSAEFDGGVLRGSFDGLLTNGPDCGKTFLTFPRDAFALAFPPRFLPNFPLLSLGCDTVGVVLSPLVFCACDKYPNTNSTMTKAYFGLIAVKRYLEHTLPMHKPLKLA